MKSINQIAIAKLQKFIFCPPSEAYHHKFDALESVELPEDKMNASIQCMC